MIDSRTLRIALLGAGNVGSQVARLLIENRTELAARAGADLELVGIAVRDVDAKRDVELPRELLTTDADSLIVGADIVIELMGGIEPARSYILKAVESGADVVTGNKALLAAHGSELLEATEQVGAEISYEASVAAAIPILRPLRDSLAGDNIRRVLAIVNGSTNFILDRMDQNGDSMADASQLARELGYLEADPTLDVEGWDAAQKATILARLAFHTSIDTERVYREGITGVTAEQIEAAKSAGYVIKLLAVAERLTAEDGTEGVSARVYPALVPREHPLASVHGGNNAVFRRRGGGRTASCSTARAPAACRRHPPSSAMWSPPLVAMSRADRGSSAPAMRRSRCCRSTTSSPSIRSTSSSRTGPACSPNSPASSRVSACRCRPSSSSSPRRKGSRPSSWAPTPLGRRRCAPRSKR